MAFKKATKAKSKLRLGLIGPTGAGKTMSALAIGSNLGGSMAVIDTEHGSASLYADIFDFDVEELESFSVQNYIHAIKEAEKHYDVIVIDSLSHAWAGKDGILEFIDKEAARNNTTNTFGAWRKGTPLYNSLVEAIVGCQAHIICTMRSKMTHSQEKDERTGKTVIKKVGLQAIQRDDIEYEFAIVGDIDHDHNIHFNKSRCAIIDQKTFHKPGKDVADILLSWLNDGTAYVPPTPKPFVETPQLGGGAESSASAQDGDIISAAQSSSLMRLNTDWSAAQVIAYVKETFALGSDWNKKMTVDQFEVAKKHIAENKPQ